MSKLTWRHGELNNISNLINKYNQKINKLKKEGYNTEMLPSRKTYNSFINSIISDKDYTRQQLNDEITIMHYFLDKNSEEILKASRGAEITKFKYNEMELRTKRINQERAKLQKQYNIEPLTNSGVLAEEPEENKKNYNLHKIKPLKFKFENMSKGDLEYKERAIKNYSSSKEKRDELYRKNYYTSLENTSTPEDYEKLKKILDTLPTSEIVKKYYTDTDMDIKENYEPSEYEGRIEVLIKAWNLTQQEYYNNLEKVEES